MLIPRRGIEYFGNLAFVGGGGGGDGGAKGRAKIGMKAIVGLANEYTDIEYDSTPEYDTLGELNVSENKFVASSEGFYKIHMVVTILSGDPAVVYWDFEILKNDTEVIAETTSSKLSDSLVLTQADCAVSGQLDENDSITSRLYYHGATQFSISPGSTVSYVEIFKW